MSTFSRLFLGSPSLHGHVAATPVPVVTNTALNPLTTPITATAPIALTPLIPATNIPTSWAITATSPSQPTWFTIAPSGGAGSGQVSLTAAGKTGMNAAGTGTESLTVTASNAGGTSAPGTATIGFQPVSSDAYASVDGSPNASTGPIQYPNILNGYRSSGSGRILGTAGPPNYAPVAPGFQPPWKVAGVDYAVGPNAGTVFKIATSGNIPAGCTLSGRNLLVGQPNGGGGTGSINVVLDSFDFSGVAPNNWVVNLWAGATCTITNCKFNGDAQLFGNSDGNGGQLSNLIVKYCTFDQTGCSHPPPTTGDNAFDCLSPCSIVIQYCWFNQGWAEALQIGGNVTNQFVDIRFNLFTNTGQGHPIDQAHGDFIQYFGGNTANAFTFNFNTGYQDPAVTSDYSSQGWSLNASEPTFPNGGSISNNTLVVVSGENVQPGFFIETQGWGAACTVNANFVDPTGITQVSNNDLTNWFHNSSFTVPGGFIPGGPINFTGNISMVAVNSGTGNVAAGGSLDNLVNNGQ